MSPKDVLQNADSELDRLIQELIAGDSAMAQPLASIESLTARLVALSQDLRSMKAADVRETLPSILTKAKRLQALLEAGTAFHCQSIFARTESPDTYGSDGTFSLGKGSGIIFQG
ncbi:MAG: hypothetical protein ACJ746_26480 [Bryobacteraceae bacterium]